MESVNVQLDGGAVGEVGALDIETLGGVTVRVDVVGGAAGGRSAGGGARETRSGPRIQTA